MAKSFGRSIDISSDVIPDHYCEPCFEVNREIKPIAGYCRDCNDELCQECYSSHLGPKPFRHHKLVDKSTRPKTKPTRQAKPRNVGEECFVHHGETLQSFCQDHSQVCCKVCLKINHQACHTEEISKLARNIQDSSGLKTLNKKLDSLRKGFNDNLNKTGANEITIQKIYREAINDMKKLRDEFDKLITETEKLFDTVKEKDFEKIENASATCDMVIEQIDKLTTNLDTLKGKGASEQLFIAMKRAESQLKSFEKTLDKLEEDNTATEYKFVPDEKVKALHNELQVLGKLSYLNLQNLVTITRDRVISISDQMTKTPTHVKDILVKSSSENKFNLLCSLVLPNKQILITDFSNKKVKLIDTNQNKIMSELQLASFPFDITKVNENEVAVTVQTPDQIQFVSIYQHSLSKGRTITVDARCRGIAYNDKDQKLIVVFTQPSKVEVLDMSGNVIKCLDKDNTGRQLFQNNPFYVSLTPDMMYMYITDSDNHSIALMTMDGDVTAVFKDQSLQRPSGIYVHKSGLVYVVGYNSNTVHQLDPQSGKFKLLLDKNNGLKSPFSISYCDLEDKMYIGMCNTDKLKAFQMK